MTQNELHILKEICDYYATKNCSHVCDDWVLDNTDENWELLLKIESGSDEPYHIKRPPIGQDLITMDFMLYHYLMDKMLDEMGYEDAE